MALFNTPCTVFLIGLVSTVFASGSFDVQFVAPSTADSTICLGAFWKRAFPLGQNCVFGRRIQHVRQGEDVLLNLPVSSLWPKKFALSLMLNDTAGASPLQFQHSGFLEGGQKWTSVELFARGSNSKLQAQLRFKCDGGFYGVDCAKRCLQPKGLNMVCAETGNLECLPGWTGNNCEIPICENGCTNGTCVAPGKCSCQAGFRGTQCDECIPFVGCLNGGCQKNRPSTCECESGWGGVLCDRDLEYCTRRSPCQNGARCTNNGGPNLYTCACTKGFYGRNCEKKIVKNYCLQAGMCSNGGTCIFLGGISFKCECLEGFEGEHCQLKKVEKRPTCENTICFNGGICTMVGGQPECSCSNGLAAPNCEDSTKMDQGLLKTDESRISTIALLIIGTLFLFSTLVFAALLVCRWRNRNNSIFQNNFNEKREERQRPLVNHTYKAVPLPLTKDVQESKKLNQEREKSEERYTSHPTRPYVALPVVALPIEHTCQSPDSDSIYEEIDSPNTSQRGTVSYTSEEFPVTTVSQTIPFQLAV